MALDDQRLKSRHFQIGKDLEHVPFSGFSGNCADIAGFGTIAWAPEISMAYINVPIGSLHGVGEKRLDFSRQWNTAKSFGFLSG
jgi:hypothetical protein